MPIADLALALLALTGLAIAAEQFVTGAARIATRLGASQMFIGAALLGAVATALLATGRTLGRWEGVVLVCAYLLALPLVT